MQSFLPICAHCSKRSAPCSKPNASAPITSIAAPNERTARLHVESELAASKETVERLQLLVKEYERARFGKRSEKFDPDQLQLVLEDIEIAIAEVQEREDDRARRSGRPATRERAGRAARAFPAHLPRVERVIEPASLACPCGCGLMVRIGEDRSCRLDVTPAQYRVIETVRPRYACPKGCAGVAQAPAPAHLIEGGVPTEALLAQVAVAKFSEHMPLYRQSQVFARHGIMLDRAVLADWMGTTAFHLAPLVERMSALMKLSGRLFMDETTAPVLDPGRGRTKTGYLWAVLRDDRGHGGADPPIVVYHYAPGRGGEHAERILEGFRRRPPSRRIWRLSSTGAARTQRRRAAAARLVLEPWKARDHRRHAEGGLAHRRGDPRAYRGALCDRGGDKRQRDVDPAQRSRERSRPLVAELEDFLRAQAARLSGPQRDGKGRRLSSEPLGRADAVPWRTAASRWIRIWSKIKSDR